MRVRIELTNFPGAGDVHGDLEFVVDTASTDSCLHPQEISAIQSVSRGVLMDASQWPLKRGHAGIGGIAVYYIAPCIYVLLHDDGREQRIQGTIDIAQPTIASFGLPSILGWGVLQHFALHLDWSQRLVEMS